MQSILPLLICAVPLTLAGSIAWSSAPAKLDPATMIWFDHPAASFTESLPLGSGRLGAMVFGGVEDERIVMNEISMWSGSPQNADRSDAHKSLPEIRRLLQEGKIIEAQNLVAEKFTCRGSGSCEGSGADVPFGCYQTLGDLVLKFHHAAGSNGDYRRYLDLRKAIASVEYEHGGIWFKRETFATAPNEAIVTRISANRPKSISFDAVLTRAECSETVESGPNEVLMRGSLSNGTGGKGMNYAARLRVVNRGGKVTVEGGKLTVQGADEVLLFITAATDYDGLAGRHTKDAAQASRDDMNRATAKTYAQLEIAHVKDHRKYFDRAGLTLFNKSPESLTTARLPTDQRLASQGKGISDPSLAVLYFNFGRYLLISSSRPGGLPANLQGLWAEEIEPPWNGDYHLNINVQMNYWPAEVCNLSELHDPLLKLIESLQRPGAQTAKAYYDARGWVSHVITNVWGFTSPGQSASWGASTSTGWLCEHLWEHYAFTQDKRYLAWAYPIMKGAAQFYLDMLIPEPKHGWLVTGPSNSPENHFRLPGGESAYLCMGPSIDQEQVRELFGNCIEAARVLGVDEDFRQELAVKRRRLAPLQIGPDGRLQEWLEPYEEVEPQHRHVSHLYGLYPGSEISSPELADAARQTLKARGDSGTGWSKAWKICFWARLLDGNHAHKMLMSQLKPVTDSGYNMTNGGGTYPNLFDAHPPFQIDGNFGATAGIAEMLMQSQGGVIHLLPALPDAWPNGKVTGLRARGGYEVGIEWKNGKLTNATIKSLQGGKCTIRYGSVSRSVSLTKGETYCWSDDPE